MNEAQARRLEAGQYVASLNALHPVGYKVTRIAVPADDSDSPTVIQVSQLYGEDWVLAAAFHPVEGPTLTRDEVSAFHRARIAGQKALDDAAAQRFADACDAAYDAMRDIPFGAACVEESDA